MPNKSPEQQQTFDLLLARGMKMIFSDETAPKIAKAVSSGDPAKGLQSMTNAIVNKIYETAKSSGKQIPREMIPSLSLGLMSQVAEAAQAAGVEVSDEAIVEAFKGLTEQQVDRSLKRGTRTPEEVQGAIDKVGGQQAPQEQQGGLLQ